MIQSLRFRLAAWHGALTGAIVIIICSYSYAVHARAHYDQADMLLHDAARHVAEELATARTPADQQNVLMAARMLESRIRVYSSGGQLVLGADAGLPPVDPRTLGRPQRAPFGLLPSLAPSLHRIADPMGRYDVVRAANGERWRAIAYPIADGRVLVAAAPLGPIDESVHAFARLMVIMALLGTALSFGAGWMLASRALRPVAAMRETAYAITQSRELSRRIPVPRTGDELSHLAATFNGMLGSLEEANAAQQRFVSDASHELRAPLTAVQANLELLRRERRMPPEERTRAIEEAFTEATRMTRLVADLLALARADAGVPLRRTGVELDRTMLDVMGEARHLTHGQTLEVAYLEPTLLSGDPDGIRQLLLILLDNAIRYTPSSGRVVVDLRHEDDRAIVTVRDTGVGIAPDALPHVFERFYRGDRSRVRDPGGTGLGLPIARWIAEQHGGTLALESELGRGTVARVNLPITS
ncbi:MAG: sensor histidine kinase [Gemmatimonadaceae bacterium]